jgi:O-antigen ligase
MSASALSAWQARAGQACAVLFPVLFFFLPNHVAPAYSLTLVMLVLWCIEGDFARKWAELRQDSLFWIFLALYAYLLLGMAWTEDVREGKRALGRYLLFAVSPLFLSVGRRVSPRRCISIFLAGMLVCEVLAYYNWFQMHVFPDGPAGPRVRKDPDDTAPFVDHILYSPMLAWAGYLLLDRCWSANTWRVRLGYAAFALLTLGNLMFSGGRAGQLVFLILLGVLVFQKFARHPLRAAVLAVLAVVGALMAAYQGNGYFRERVDIAVTEVSHYQEMKNTSTGLRLTFYANSLRMLAEHPLTGVGTGDFTQEYARLNARYTPDWGVTDNPHNQYLFIFTSLGIPGGVLLLLALFPPALWHKRGDGLDALRLGFVVFFGSTCMFEDYLWRSNTSILFFLHSSIFFACRVKMSKDCARV